MGEQWILALQEKWRAADPERESERRSRRCIYKVPKCMRGLNGGNAYTPQIISFGPYHHGREHLRAMEPVKRIVLGLYLNQVQRTLEHVANAMRNEVQVLMDAYSDLQGPWKDENRFLELMILDGCHLLELLLMAKKLLEEYSIGEEELFTTNTDQYEVMYDGLLLEN